MIMGTSQLVLIISKKARRCSAIPCLFAVSITNTIACLFFNVYNSGLKQSDSDILTKLIAPPEPVYFK